MDTDKWIHNQHSPTVFFITYCLSAGHFSFPTNIPQTCFFVAGFDLCSFISLVDNFSRLLTHQFAGKRHDGLSFFQFSRPPCQSFS